MFRVEGHRIIALEESFSQCCQSSLVPCQWRFILPSLPSYLCSTEAPVVWRKDAARFCSSAPIAFGSVGASKTSSTNLLFGGVYSTYIAHFMCLENRTIIFQSTKQLRLYESLDTLGVGLWNPRGISRFPGVASYRHLNQQPATVLDSLDPCRPGDAWEASQDIPGTKWDCHTSH